MCFRTWTTLVGYRDRIRLADRDSGMVENRMKYDIDKALQPFYNVRQMLEGIPRDIWDVFLPAAEEKLAVLESNILFFRRRAKDRDQVMSIQRLCGFPLRPNSSLRETNIKARLAGLQKEKLRQKYLENRNRDSEDDTASDME